MPEDNILTENDSCEYYLNEKFRAEIYYSEGISAFEMLRDRSKHLLSAVTKRLIMENPVILGQKTTVSKETFSFRIFSDFFKTAGTILFKIYLFIKLVPSFVVQKNSLKIIWKSQHLVEALILTASPRLLNNLMIEKNNLRGHFSLLASEFSSRKNSSNVADDIKIAKNLFVFDPVFSSTLWQHKKMWLKDNIYVIDINFILFLFITFIFTLDYSFIKNFLYLISRKHGEGLNHFKRIKVALCSTIILFVYKKIIKDNFHVMSYYFTSNSFATEILRCYLMQHATCYSICEILHGVPTLEFNNYIHSLIKLGDKYHLKNKLFFISQIPRLPKYGIFKDHINFPEEIAINTYLNNYIMGMKNSNGILNDIIEEECDLYFKQKFPKDALIITFIGGTVATTDEKFISTETFSIEKFMINHIKKILTCRNIPFILIYAPHPCHHWNEISQCDFFAKEQIILYRKTIFSWLISDICISLYSSALFEAAFFGAKTFTPLKMIDGLYPKALLNYLTYHEMEANTLEDEIASFILSYSKNNREDVQARAIRRSKNFPRFD